MSVSLCKEYICLGVIVFGKELSNTLQEGESNSQCVKYYSPGWLTSVHLQVFVAQRLDY